jgi:GDPmannose 4,6-dehydratase
MKTALISGATGQDGSYLIELLLEKDYKVFCIIRHSANPNFSRIKHLLDKITILDADLTDPSSLREAIRVSDPDEVYNLAAQSFVGLSWKQPELTSQITGIGCLNFLQALKEIKPTAKFYQASSSEMFGKVHEVPQKEDTVLHPRSPYGVAKVFAHYMTINYRESYNMFCVSGILYNHESQRRGVEFVTRKISNSVARIKLGLQSKLRLGNLDAKRDWGHAKDYVYGMWLMLQQDTPDDYILATGETYSVREFVEIAFNHVGLNWEDYVVIDPAFFRPAEVDLLIGDPTKAKAVLGCEPKISCDNLVKEMVDHDLELESLNLKQ